MIKKTNFLVENISWLFLDKVVRIFGGLFIGMWVARYLGPNNFGILNYSMAYITLFSLFTNIGLDKILVRELVKCPEKESEILGTAFYLKLSGSIVGVVLVIISLCFFEFNRDTKIIILILSLYFIPQSLDVIDFYFQAKVLSKYVVLARNCAFFLSSISKIFLILKNCDVTYFAIVNCLDFFYMGIFLLVIYTRIGRRICLWHFNFKIAKKLLIYCWPLALSTFLITVHMKIDQVMIGKYLNSAQVGIYSVSVRLSEAWYFVPGILVSTFMPYFIELREKNVMQYHRKLIKLYSLMFWIGIGVGSFVILWGENLIELLFGGDYIDAYGALIFNIWNGIFISQALVMGIWLINEDLQKYKLYNNLIMMILNILINIMLIPRFGISGSAIATLITQFAGTWVISFLWKPLRPSTLAMIKSVNPVYLIK